MDKTVTRRGLGVDAARGVAVLLLFVAQTAPADGPFNILQLSEFIPPPLFALLIGMTAQLATSTGARFPLFLTWGAGLIGIGMLLSLVPSQIIGMLVYLGALAIVCGLLTRLPTPAVAAVGAVLFVLEPWLKSFTQDWWYRHVMQLQISWTGRRGLELVELVSAGQSFRLIALVIYSCAGILLIRMVSGGRAHAWVASGALVLATVIFLGDKLGGPQLHPYTGSYQVLLFNLFTAVAICEFTRLVAERWKLWLEPLTEVGGMWLTMYVAMTLSTAAYLQLAPAGARDDSWVVLACLVVGALVFAVTWVRLLGKTHFREGPIEGLFDLLARRDPHTGHAVATEPAADEDYSFRSRT